MPDQNWTNGDFHNVDMNYYTGEIRIYNQFGVYVGANTFDNGIRVETDYRHSCDNDTDSSNTGGGSTGDGSGTGDGGSNSGTGSTGGDSGPIIGIEIITSCGCPPHHDGGGSNDECTCTKPDQTELIVRTADDYYKKTGKRDPLRHPCPPIDTSDQNCRCPDDSDIPDDQNDVDPSDENTNGGIQLDLYEITALNEFLEPNLTSDQALLITELDIFDELLEFLENNVDPEEPRTFEEALDAISSDQEGITLEELCQKIEEQIADPDFAEKADEINSNFNVEQEAGFEEKTDGSFEPMQPIDEHSVAFEPTASSKGYLHKHTNNREIPDENGDGIPEEVITTKIFSPNDIVLFVKMLQQAHLAGTPIEDIYGSVYTSNRDYTLRFNGNPEEAQLSNFNELNPKTLDEEYRRLIMKDGKEKGLLMFLQDEVGIEGIQLFRIKNNGDIQHKTLDENGRKQTTDCEDL